MALKLDDKLVIGVSSRALFDLESENRIFEEDGLEAYSKYQREHENDILKPGTAFPLIKALQKLNDDGRYLTEIIIMSKNSAETRKTNSHRAFSGRDLPDCRNCPLTASVTSEFTRQRSSSADTFPEDHSGTGSSPPDAKGCRWQRRWSEGYPSVPRRSDSAVHTPSRTA